jgi:hypothetical protein
VTLEGAASKALAWVGRAQDRSGSDGVASYEFYGWSSGYPEVTGYLIPTLFDHSGGEGGDLARRAGRMADWELRIQRPEGGWQSGYETSGRPPVAFNTGQVIRGLTRAYEETGEAKYFEAAVRGGDWLLTTQEADGSWARANYRGMKRVYDTYVAAPLARLAEVTGNEAYAEAARRNCDFALAHRAANGWFAFCDNSPHFLDAPNTHTLAYTVDGLLETGEALGEERFVDAAVDSAEALLRCVGPSGRLAGRLDASWRPRVRWVCLPGSAQVGILAMRLHERSGDARHVEAARRLADFLLFAQDLNDVGPEHRGALAGAFPIWGLHAPLTFPCWAAKYLLDLLLLIRRAEAAGTQAESPVAERG